MVCFPVLGCVRDERIVTEGSGRRFEPADGELDMHRFVAAAGSGRKAAATGARDEA
ncbi:hypothetical protein [Kitasatospora terrestris]|uniref:Uncharacterized protein n=1 Tax=Kitasatospora terrestris TaxID=258051 RepID=A0ABP9DA55_9ACTN